MRLLDIKPMKQEFKIEGVKGVFVKVTSLKVGEEYITVTLNTLTNETHIEQETLAVTPLQKIKGLKSY